MPDIKTREVVKGTVKAIDKSAVAAERMKDAYIRTKEKAEYSLYSAEGSPEEYAADRVTGGTEIVAHETVHHADKQGRKAVRNTKEAASKFKERFKRKRATDPAKKQARERNGDTVRHTADTVHRSADATDKAVQTVRQEQQAVKTVERGGKAVRQTVHSAERTTTRAAKDTVKTAQRSIKTVEKSTKAAIKTSQQTAKTAVKTSQQTAKVAIKTAQQTAKAAERAAQAATRAAQAAVRAAQTAARVAVTAAKAAVRATISAIKGIIAATKALIEALIAGGWIVVVVVVVICMVALIVCSCFGIFFSMDDTGTSQPMQSVIQEINADYQGQIDTIKANIAYDVLEMSGSRAVWPEVLAVYAVKVTTDPHQAQEVATMDESKKAILKDIFWQMNVISSRTKTVTETVIVETVDDEGNIVETEETVTQTYLYITVSHMTADQMADHFGFNADQRKQLAELLSEENRSVWNAVLYGIGNGENGIVKVALSQIGNGGETYWLWYGFTSVSYTHLTLPTN